MWLTEEINVIREKDPAIKSFVEVFLYPSFWAVINHRLAHFFYRHKWFFVARFISQLSRLITGIEIHPGAKIGKNCVLHTATNIGNKNGAPIIGDNVYIAPNCNIYTASHPLNSEERNKGLEYAYPVKIGNNVWIGGNVTILPGVIIGDNTTIGVGSVVTKDIPANVVAYGNPCRVAKKI